MNNNTGSFNDEELRKTKYSAGYDIEAAEDTVIPSFKKGMNPTLVKTGLKAYMQDENFGSFGNDLSMWKFYNLLTGANKSSYIDSFLDRAYNATEIATGINAALYGDERYKWFID